MQKLIKLFLVFNTILFVNNIIANTDIPSSKRSINAIKKVQNSVKKELQKNNFKLGSEAYIRIFKEENILELWLKKDKKFALFKTYPICNFSGDLGPKLKEGDNQAPEGFYFVKPNNLNPNSKFHLSFNLGFPNLFDRKHKRTGSFLMVHGSCVSIGCYAMTDKVIEEIWTIITAAFNKKQPFFRVHIFPFKMTNKNMQKYKDHRWFDFWKNLKVCYDKFTEYKNIPPNVMVKNKKYIFNYPKN